MHTRSRVLLLLVILLMVCEYVCSVSYIFQVFFYNISVISCFSDQLDCLGSAGRRNRRSGEQWTAFQSKENNINPLIHL